MCEAGEGRDWSPCLARATRSWTITRGNIDRAYIDGPSNGTTVNIRGYRPSRAADDVTVQLTDGHCTVTHRLTVVTCNYREFERVAGLPVENWAQE